VVNINWFTVLLAALAPVVWPLDRRVTNEVVGIEQAAAAVRSG
jgi:hypothetical protein